jgi:tripartite-type tricarboxylate transporter receptor subunit TctC
MNRSIQVMVVLAGFFAAVAAQAQQWPSRLIKATIPFGAGSATDVVPRLVFDRLAVELGQSIVVENRPGAGGTLGTALVAKAAPDGYSILGHSSALTIAPAIFSPLSYDVANDLAAALMIGYLPNVMIVPVSRPWQSVQAFLAAAKQKDAAISYGSVGVGSAVHISAEKFRLAAGFEASHVPYRGGAEVIADILGGRLDFYFCPLATALPLIRDHQVRALVVSSTHRVAELPEVPTTIEAGLVNADSVAWIGVFMPAKTPRDVVERFHAAGVKVLDDPATSERLRKLGVEPVSMSPSEMDELVKRDLAANAAVIKAAGITAN